VGAGADIDAVITAITTGESANLDGGNTKGIFEAAKGARSGRSSSKKIDMARRLVTLQGIQAAQADALQVIAQRDTTLFNCAIGYSDNPNNGGGGGVGLPNW
jgi:hypothetical protein